MIKEEENSQIIDLINWIKKNKKPFFSTLITIVVIALIVVFVCVRIHLVNNAASDKLNMAVQVIGSGNVEQGISILDDLINTYKNTPAAYRGVMMKANYLVNQQKYEEAEALVKDYIVNAKPENVRAIGYPLLITISDNSGNVEQAISISNEFLAKYPGNYLVPSVMENLARLYKVAGNEEEAKKVYEDIVNKYPGTAHAEDAEEKLK